MGGPRDPRHLIAPHVRGRVDDRVLTYWSRTGWHVHRVGRAAYVHRGDMHLLMGVWDRLEVPPVWAARLGRPSLAYERRQARRFAAESHRRMQRRANGRFWTRLPWWRWPVADRLAR